MQQFVIRRRNGWQTGADLEVAAQRSKDVAADEFPDSIRWIRSYVVEEADGTLGTVCIYEAASADAVVEHAASVGMPADEISAVLDTVVVRVDPQPATA